MAVYSMTGYNVTHGSCTLGNLAIELRSVNSRFLDLTLRQNEDLRFTEPAVRELLQKRLARGKLELRMNLVAGQTQNAPQINRQALERVLAIQSAIRDVAADARPLSVSDLLKTPGVLEAETVDQSEVTQEVLALLNTALDQFVETRRREGEALANILRTNCDQIEAVVDEVKGRLPDILEHINKKLTERLESVLTSKLSDASLLTKEEINDRIRQEVTLYAVRMDVEEEMNRLRTHINETRHILDKGGAIGRRLDFLVQEMNREANTLGSKAAAIDMTNAALQLKVIIEQMREQIQNIE